jgi:hypothetical protein
VIGGVFYNKAIHLFALDDRKDELVGRGFLSKPKSLTACCISVSTKC